MNTKTLVLILGTMLAPQLTSAQNMEYVNSVASGLGAIFGVLVPVLTGAAVLVFVWGLVQFITQSGDEKAHTEGKNKMVWGLVALFVIVSVWGLVSLLQTITGISPETINAPRALGDSRGGPRVELGELECTPGPWCEPDCPC